MRSASRCRGGDPVAGPSGASASEADELGLRYLYRRLDLERLQQPASAIGEILAAARLAGYDGLNVTHPCKQLVLEHLDALSPDAEALGAVNTVVLRDGRAVGHNTDWSGFAGHSTGAFPRPPSGGWCCWEPVARVPPSRTRCSPSAPVG